MKDVLQSIHPVDVDLLKATPEGRQILSLHRKGRSILALWSGLFSVFPSFTIGMVLVYSGYPREWAGLISVGSTVLVTYLLMVSFDDKMLLLFKDSRRLQNIRSGLYVLLEKSPVHKVLFEQRATVVKQ